MSGSQQLTFDPKLRLAMAEIRRVLEKYEIGGVAVLSSKTHHEFAEMFPWWCTIKRTGMREVRVRLTTKSNPDLAAASAAYVLGTRDMLQRLGKEYAELGDAVMQAAGERIQHSVATDADIDFTDGGKAGPYG